MALNTSKCNRLTPLRFKGLKQEITQRVQIPPESQIGCFLRIFFCEVVGISAKCGSRKTLGTISQRHWKLGSVNCAVTGVACWLQLLEISLSTAGRLPWRPPATDDQAYRDLELQVETPLTLDHPRRLPHGRVRRMIDSCWWRHRLRHAHSAAVNTIQ